MRLSTKGRFAVTAMIDLGLHQRHGPVPLSAIAQRQHISLSYLEQMFSRLRQDGLVESTRGPGGGYTLGNKGEDITVADIMCSIEGAVVGAGQDGESGTSVEQADMTQALWDALSQRLLEHMQAISLRSLIAEQLTKGVVAQPRRSARQGIYRRPEPQPARARAPNSVFALGASILAKG